MKLCKLVALCLVLATPGSAFGEEIAIERAITDVSEQIGNLIHLKWNENRLAIDRAHWKNAADNKTEAEQEQEELNAMIERGIPADIAKRMMAEKLRKQLARNRGLLGRAEQPETGLFDALTTAVGANSRGRSGGSNGMHYRGVSEKLYITMFNNSSTEEFRFAISHREAPSQELVIEEHPERGLRIQLSASSQLIVFSQISDGTVRVAKIRGKSSEAFSCPSYDEMVVAYPAFSKELASIFEQLNINTPLSSFDPRVVEAVGRMLHPPSPEAVAAASKAIAALGSLEYEDREAAQDEVGRNAELWRYVIQQELADPALDIEIKTRLERVVEEAGIGMAAEEIFIDRRKLLQDSDYLSAILPRVSAAVRPSVQRRINELRADH